MAESRELKSIVDAIATRQSAKGEYKGFKISPSLKGGESAWYSCFDAKINSIVQKGNWYNFVITLVKSPQGEFWNITKADKAEGFQLEPLKENGEIVESSDKTSDRRGRSIVYQAIAKYVLNSQGLMYQGEANKIELIEWISRVKQIIEEILEHHDQMTEGLK